MNRESVILTATVAGTAVVLLALGAFFMETGSKTAGYLLMASPILVGVGVLFMKRGMVSMTKYSLPLQLKSRELVAFSDLYNGTESRLSTSARLLGGKRADLPDLSLIRKPVESYLIVDSSGRVQPNPRKSDALDLATLNRQRSQLVTINQQADAVIQGGLNALLAAAAPILNDLRKMGLVETQSPTSAGHGNAQESLQQAHASLREAAAHAQEGLSQALQAVAALYKDTATEAALANEGRAALANDAVIQALASFRDAGGSLEAKLKNEFGKKRNEALHAVVLLTEASRRGGLSPPLQERIKKLEGAADRIRSPLQLNAVEPLRRDALEAAHAALAETEQRARDGSEAAWKGYLVAHGGPAAIPNGDQPTPAIIADWQARFETLAVGITDASRDAKLRPLYQKLRPVMEATLAQSGRVTAADLKLRDAQGLFAQFATDHPGTEVKDGALVQSAAAAPKAKKAPVPKKASKPKKGSEGKNV